MKRILYSLLGLALLGLFVWTGIFLYRKSEKKPTVFTTEAPFVTDITKKTVATGSIKPRVEVLIKPQVSGIVEQMYVDAGQVISAGQPIARIRIVPNVVNLNNAEATVRRAEINLENSRRELDRNDILFKNKVLPDVEYRKFTLAYKLAQEELSSAKSNLQLVREGTSATMGSSNIVAATVGGLLLDTPVKAGGSVVERNNFNEGTTLATIADMNSMVFFGKVDESEVGRLTQGMTLDLNVGALENQIFQSRLEYIAPKGILEDGAIKFEIRAAVVLRKDVFLRAGYSATADIVVGRREKVLAVKEGDVEFKGDTTYVEVETAPQKFEKRQVKLGLSDGINIEVLGGLQPTDRIKVPQSGDKKPQNG